MTQCNAINVPSKDCVLRCHKDDDHDGLHESSFGTFSDGDVVRTRLWRSDSPCHAYLTSDGLSSWDQLATTDGGTR